MSSSVNGEMDFYLSGSSLLNNKLYLNTYSVSGRVLGPRTLEEQDRQGLWIEVLMCDGGSHQEIRQGQIVAVMKEINSLRQNRKGPRGLFWTGQSGKASLRRWPCD